MIKNKFCNCGRDVTNEAHIVVILPKVTIEYCLKCYNTAFKKGLDVKRWNDTYEVTIGKGELDKTLLVIPIV